MAYFMPASAPSFHPAPFPVFGAPQNQSLSGPQVFKQVEILVGQGESFGSLMKRFKRAVSKSGVMQDARRHQHFETTQEKKKREKLPQPEDSKGAQHQATSAPTTPTSQQEPTCHCRTGYALSRTNSDSLLFADCGIRTQYLRCLAEYLSSSTISCIQKPTQLQLEEITWFFVGASVSRSTCEVVSASFPMHRPRSLVLHPCSPFSTASNHYPTFILAASLHFW
eukprot:CAMPEP_0196652412 /NCGR_PEP_ID=MMETSP1086-20130531/1685_1 /TAXON_ID=77921 /ORGANISM="Cyanoptyche  gloeocystis , Strain SAG4.97" /LENGTH=223 /DNA_ID=CAMNT_0041982941 /DNA_START=80 /DNA_END=748 /DNA_ORIENTATION=-